MEEHGDDVGGRARFVVAGAVHPELASGILDEEGPLVETLPDALEARRSAYREVLRPEFAFKTP